MKDYCSGESEAFWWRAIRLRMILCHVIPTCLTRCFDNIHELSVITWESTVVCPLSVHIRPVNAFRASQHGGGYRRSG